MMAGSAYRGQPLVAFTLVLGGWIAVRTMLWDAGAMVPPPVLTQPAVAAGAPAMSRTEPKPTAEETPGLLSPWPMIGASRPDEGTDYGPRPRAVMAPPLPVVSREPMVRRQNAMPLPPSFLMEPPPSAFMPSRAPVAAQVSAAHQLLWMAALSRVPLPAAAIAQVAPTVSQPESRPRMSRWSADAWILQRQGGSTVAAGGIAPATYGASQAGGVVRYNLALGSAYRPAAYFRATTALNGSRETEGAIGLSARPLPGLPIVAAAELRVTGQPGRTRVRPAALVYTQLSPIALPHGLRSEVYAQAGYVAGSFSTPFADGQVKVDRHVGTFGRAELRAGGGVWGGAQKGAARLDAGPSATLGMPVSSSASARVAVDWRFRLAGNAEPTSGPALTLSAGF